MLGLTSTETSTVLLKTGKKGVGGMAGGGGGGRGGIEYLCNARPNRSDPQKHAPKTATLVECCFTSRHRNRRLIRDGSPGRPPRLSHSS